MSVTPFPSAIPQPGALGDSMRAFATNVMGFQPDSERSWRAHIAGLVRPLRDAFAQHRAATEGSAGLYAELVHDAPRLAGAVDGLVREHATLDGAMARLAAIAASVEGDAAVLRREALAVLDELARHDQRGSDLLYEAYAIDIGGE